MKDLFGLYNNEEYNKCLRIPYMGSKNKIATELLNKMIDIKPNAKYFVDLFGGGGAMSFIALQRGFTVLYNELDTNLVNFLKFIIDRIKSGERSKFGLFPKEFYTFVDRETFFKHIKEDTIFAQFCRICYSFGNAGRDYAFGKDREEIKHLGHDVVIFKDESALYKLNVSLGINIPMPKGETWNERRLNFVKSLSTIKLKNNLELQSLENLERLQRLENLENLQSLERLQRFSIYNLDFKDVLINFPTEETIVYLDPPYRNTAKYKEDTLSNVIDEYFRQSQYTTFMSEYNAPFESILEIKKARLFDNSKEKRSYAVEKLFFNGVL